MVRLGLADRALPSPKAAPVLRPSAPALQHNPEDLGKHFGVKVFSFHPPLWPLGISAVISILGTDLMAYSS